MWYMRRWPPAAGRAAGPAHLRKSLRTDLSMQQNVKKRKPCCFLQRFDIIIALVKSQQNHLVLISFS